MKTILIVDDQQGIRLLLHEVFKKEGYYTELAANGVEALQIVNSKPVDCALLDMKIPGMNGIDILRMIRETHKEMPVLMMTAYGEQDIIEEAIGLGATGYFAKPFNIFDIIAKVKELLGDK